MAGISVKTGGFRKVGANVGKVTRDTDRALAAALYEKGLAVDAEAVVLTPVDTGRLRASHYVAPPTRGKEENPEVELGFGTDYAEDVHERPTAHRPPTQSKFLEKPFYEHLVGWLQWLKARTVRNLALGLGVDAIPASAPTAPKSGGSGGRSKEVK